MNKNWLAELLPHLIKNYDRQTFTEQEITASIAVTRGMSSNETLVRAFRWLVKMGIASDAGDGYYLLDKKIIADFTKATKPDKKRS